MIREYKRQQLLLLVYGGDAGLFEQRKGDKAVEAWCTTLFGGTSIEAIKKGSFGWENQLVECLRPEFAWKPENADARTSHNGRQVLHFRSDRVPQQEAFHALQHSIVFRRIFDSLKSPAYPHPALDIGPHNINPATGTARDLALQVKTLVRILGWDEKHSCARTEQLGWDPTEKELVIPLDKCPGGKKDSMQHGTIVEVGELKFVKEISGSLLERWVPKSKVVVVRKATKRRASDNQHGNHDNKRSGGTKTNKNRCADCGREGHQSRRNKHCPKHSKSGGSDHGGSDKRTICKFFRNGHCKYGSKCHMRHQ